MGDVRGFHRSASAFFCVKYRKGWSAFAGILPATGRIGGVAGVVAHKIDPNIAEKSGAFCRADADCRPRACSPRGSPSWNAWAVQTWVSRAKPLWAPTVAYTAFNQKLYLEHQHRRRPGPILYHISLWRSDCWPTKGNPTDGRAFFFCFCMLSGMGAFPVFPPKAGDTVATSVQATDITRRSVGMVAARMHSFIRLRDRREGAGGKAGATTFWPFEGHLRQHHGRMRPNWPLPHVGS